MKNLPRVVRYRMASAGGRGASSLVDELNREGIVIRPFEELMENERALFEEASSRAHHRWDEARRSPSRPAGAVPGGYGRKDYKVPLLAPQLSIEDPFVRVALQPRLLRLVNRYLGMHSSLRAIELWWDRPTSIQAKETQLWHRDGDDLMNVKVFVYFTDVDLETGPFCFIPRTHPRGERRWLTPEHDVEGRTTDEQMTRVIPQSKWQVCLGSAGTVAICDTCGYHKGLKPSHNERLMLMLQYTSGTPRYPRVIELVGEPEKPLGYLQRCVIG
jgi:hypothetical protein